MAKSQFEYVKQFEMDDRILPQTFLVVRIDGEAFTKFTSAHSFEKPNDRRALLLANSCAMHVAKHFGDVVLCFGQSDEYSFVLKRHSKLFGRRSSKIATQFVSLFTANYVFQWSDFFPDVPLQYAPSFDARVVAYPTLKTLRDYLSWRQVRSLFGIYDLALQRMF